MHATKYTLYSFQTMIMLWTPLVMVCCLTAQHTCSTCKTNLAICNVSTDFSCLQLRTQVHCRIAVDNRVYRLISMAQTAQIYRAMQNYNGQQHTRNRHPTAAYRSVSCRHHTMKSAPSSGMSAENTAFTLSAAAAMARKVCCARAAA